MGVSFGHPELPCACTGQTTARPYSHLGRLHLPPTYKPVGKKRPMKNFEFPEYLLVTRHKPHDTADLFLLRVAAELDGRMGKVPPRFTDQAALICLMHTLLRMPTVRMSFDEHLFAVQSIPIDLASRKVKLAAAACDGTDVRRHHVSNSPCDAVAAPIWIRPHSQHSF